MHATAIRLVVAGIMAWVLSWGPVPESLAKKSDDTLVVAIQRAIRSVDRLYTRPREGLILAQLTDDGLFYVDPETLDYVPLAAESYKWVDDTTLDVTLRANVTFHDGSPLTVDDVVYTYRYVLNRKSRTANTNKLRRWLKRVRRLDDRTVRFELKHAYPLALRDMAISIYLRKEGAYLTKGDKQDPNAQALALNGLGPYKVVSFDPGKKVVVERFDSYYADSPKGRPAIRRIVFRTIPDWGTQQAELMSGGVQWMYTVPRDIAENIGKTPLATHLAGPSMRVGFIVLDAVGYTGKDNPFTKLEVRQAMNHAINREAIVKHIAGGVSEVIHSACHPVQFGCTQNVKKYAYSPETARKLLTAAGYPKGFEFDFWAYREKPVAEAIMADLAHVGVKARMRYVKSGTLGRARRSREVQSYFATWGSGSTADTAAIASVHFSPKSNRNLSRDREVEKHIMDAERTIDREARQEAYEQGLGLIAERALWVPLYAYTLNYLVANDVDFEPPRDGLPRLFLVKWK